MKIMPTTATAERLLKETEFPLISLYMPTHRAGPDIWQDQIRFKNLLRSAEHDLETAGVSRSQIDSLLQPLVDRKEDREFWQYQADGLALFQSKNGLEEFRLPTRVPEVCIVGSRFHLKPLLMSIIDRQSFFVLALSQNRVRLFRGSPSGLREVEGWAADVELNKPSAKDGNGLQSHGAGRGVRIVHASETDHKVQLADYCRRVDHALKSVISDGDLVILASVDYVGAIFREESSLRGLAVATVSGNPDESTPDELFEKSAPIAAKHANHHREEAERRFLYCLSSERGLDDPAKTLLAAQQGRIDTLFVPVGVQMWGEISADGEVRMSDGQQPQDQDLLNLALLDTLKTGGQVLAVSPDKMPGGRTIAAITRY